MQKIVQKINRKLSVSMVSTFPPDKDGIASYTARLEDALKSENISVRIFANGREWKRNSLSYILSIIQKIAGSENSLVHFQLSYFMFGNEYYTGLFPFVELCLKSLGKRVIITLHDIVPSPDNTSTFIRNIRGTRFLRFKQLALKVYTKIVCSLADKVIVHSQIGKDVLINDYAVKPTKITVIPHGIDQNIKAGKLEIASKPKILPTLTYFGFVRQGKGLEDLVHAWKKINFEANLVIIGGKHPHLNDHYMEKLVGLVKELNLENSIHFEGYVPTEFLPNYLSASDAFVFPYNEWGEVIASSGALSIVAPYLKPIVATDVPAFINLKDFGIAEIVNRGDIDGLAAAITSVLTDDEKRTTLHTRLRQWLPESSWTTVAKKTQQLYRDIDLA